MWWRLSGTWTDKDEYDGYLWEVHLDDGQFSAIAAWREMSLDCILRASTCGNVRSIVSF